MSASTAMTCPIVFGPASMAASRALLKKKGLWHWQLANDKKPRLQHHLCCKKGKKGAGSKAKDSSKKDQKGKRQKEGKAVGNAATTLPPASAKGRPTT